MNDLPLFQQTQRQRGRIKYAKLENSPRLQRLLAVLQDANGRELTTREIIASANICAVNAAACELRENGYDVRCERRGDLWFYSIPVSNQGLGL